MNLREYPVTQHIARILLLYLSVASAYAQVPPDIQAYRQEPMGDYSWVRKGIMDGNRVRTIYFNTTEITHWPDGMGGEWPKGTGHCYIDGVSILFGAKIHLPGGGVITPVEGHFRGWYDFDPALGSQYAWDLEPVPGYSEQSRLTPAISNVPQTWPPSWNNKWHGMNGTDSLHGELETYFVVDDSKDAEYTRPPYGFFPIPSDSSRKGLGLRVETRGLQWNADTLARDMIFFVYDVINLSDCDYDTAAFGVLFIPGVGSYSSSTPSQTVTFSPSEDMLIATATSGLGYPDNWQTGYVGLVFLETPTKSASDSLSAGIGGMCTHARTDYGLSGLVLRNDSTLWQKMTSEFADTMYNNATLAAVIGTRIFAMNKWTTQRFAVAFVFAQTRDSLSVKAAYARRIAAAGYRTTPSTTGLPSTTLAGIPALVSLDQNYPNPFNPSTVIRYGLPQRSQITLTVYNTLGQQVATLVNGDQEAGFHEMEFDARELSSGVYFCRLTAGSWVQTRKLVLVR
jgi:hypothetical protein